VTVAPDAVARVARLLGAEADVDAVFGSYDRRPRAPGIVSQYRNLLHHWVHQHGNAEASTFWAGCGAVRRSAFDAVGGFDEAGAWRSIEDIELGYRLRRTGHRIRLDHALQGTHLKRWTLTSMLRTDLFGRAAPWTRLIRQRATAPADLNLGRVQRLCVALVGVAMVCAALALARPALAVVAAVLLAIVIALNVSLYRFFYEQRGLAFAVACVPLHTLYFACSGAGYLYGSITPPPDAMRSAT